MLTQKSLLSLSGAVSWDISCSHLSDSTATHLHCSLFISLLHLVIHAAVMHTPPPPHHRPVLTDSSASAAFWTPSHQLLTPPLVSQNNHISPRQSQWRPFSPTICCNAHLYVVDSSSWWGCCACILVVAETAAWLSDELKTFSNVTSSLLYFCCFFVLFQFHIS